MYLTLFSLSSRPFLIFIDFYLLYGPVTFDTNETIVENNGTITVFSTTLAGIGGVIRGKFHNFGTVAVSPFVSKTIVPLPLSSHPCFPSLLFRSFIVYFLLLLLKGIGGLHTSTYEQLRYITCSW